MPPTLPSEETAENVSTGLPASRKWLVQAALLFGLLGLGRWSRHSPSQLQASNLLPPGAQAPAFPAVWRKLMPGPSQPPAATVAALARSEP